MLYAIQYVLESLRSAFTNSQAHGAEQLTETQPAFHEPDPCSQEVTAVTLQSLVYIASLSSSHWVLQELPPLAALSGLPPLQPHSPP